MRTEFSWGTSMNTSWLNRKSLTAGGYWLVIQVVIGLLPLWGIVLVLSLFKQPLGLYELTSKGEFVLYAASFLAGGLYSLRHDFFPARNGLIAIQVLLLVATSIIFGSISVVDIGKNPDWLVLDKELWTLVNASVFSIAILVCFCITVAEAGNAGFNIPDAMRRERKKVEAGLDALLEQEGGKQ